MPHLYQSRDRTLCCMRVVNTIIASKEPAHGCTLSRRETKGSASREEVVGGISEFVPQIQTFLRQARQMDGLDLKGPHEFFFV
jgi:hypothetical protein